MRERSRHRAAYALVLLPLLCGCTALLNTDFEARHDGSIEPDADSSVDGGPDAGEPTPMVWTDVSGGESHTCGLGADGTLWCWGRGSLGRRGDGTTTGLLATPQRVLAAGESPGGAAWSDWTAIVAGRYHACGLRENKSLWCWGNGANGERGDGTTISTRSTPTQVLASAESGQNPWTDWIAVVAGQAFTCGLRENKTLWCWGEGLYGRRGDGLATTERTTPTQVLAAAESGAAPWQDWVAVTANGVHTCGLRETAAEGRTAWCWGHGGNGSRGDGSTVTTRATPTQVLAAGESTDPPWEDWVAIDAGRAHTCGRRAGNSLWCWGGGSTGTRGDGTIDSNRATPIRVVAAGQGPGGATWSDWLSVTGTLNTVCGLRAAGTMWCWGDGTYGKRGDGSTTPLERSSPIQVLAADEPFGGISWNDWIYVRSGRHHACGIRDGGSLWCWGRGHDGQRGDGVFDEERTTPVEVQIISP
jgi:alpha-tubulin suppressor-like RCC1 family protein